jgi:hypothetical protein
MSCYRGISPTKDDGRHLSQLGQIRTHLRYGSSLRYCCHSFKVRFDLRRAQAWSTRSDGRQTLRRAVPSSHPVTRYFPSWLKATRSPVAERAISDPVWKFQTRTVPSSPAIARCSPSGLEMSDSTATLIQLGEKTTCFNCSKDCVQEKGIARG